jgi:hypothetical protein
MKVKSFLLVVIFALTPVMWAQSALAQEPAPGPGRGQSRAEHRQDMMDLHKQEMEEMKADVEKMKSSLEQMKANLLTIRDGNEMDRWRNNVDMWETMVGHMDRMLKHTRTLANGPSKVEFNGRSSDRHPSDFRRPAYLHEFSFGL